MNGKTVYIYYSCKRKSAPSCSYSASTELISNLKTTMEISIDGGSYTPVEATTYDMSSLVDTLTGEETLEVRVRVKATTTAPASVEKILTIGARATSTATATEPEFSAEVTNEENTSSSTDSTSPSNNLLTEIN